jgi:hypothetical protein
LGVAKSTAFLWIRHMSVDEVERDRQRREHSKVMTDSRWGPAPQSPRRTAGGHSRGRCQGGRHPHRSRPLDPRRCRLLV